MFTKNTFSLCLIFFMNGKVYIFFDIFLKLSKNTQNLLYYCITRALNFTCTWFNFSKTEPLNFVVSIILSTFIIDNIFDKHLKHTVMETLLSKVKAGELQTILDLILKALKLIDWTGNPFMEKLITLLTNQKEELDKSLLEEKKNAFTQKLSDKDDIRDGWWKGIGGYLRSAINFPGMVGYGASILYEIFKSAGDRVQDQSYELETSSIIVTMEKLRAPELSGYVSSVHGLDTYLTALSQVNDEFFLLFEQRNQMETQTEDCLPTSVVKKEVLDIINKQLIPFVDVMKITDEASYGELAKSISLYINDLNTKIRVRTTKAENEQETEEIPTETTEQ